MFADLCQGVGYAACIQCIEVAIFGGVAATTSIGIYGSERFIAGQRKYL